jgi:hypothetical protein
MASEHKQLRQRRLSAGWSHVVPDLSSGRCLRAGSVAVQPEDHAWMTVIEINLEERQVDDDEDA